MKYTIIVEGNKVYLKEFNRMLSPVGLTVHPTILEEYTSYYESVDSNLKKYEVEDGLVAFLLNKYNSGITEVVEGVDFHMEQYKYFTEPA